MEGTELIPIINIVGFLVLLGATTFFQWRQGESKVSTDVIVTYRERVEQLVDENKLIREELLRMKAEVAELRGMLSEKDRKLEEYVQILTGRDPEAQMFMKKTSEALIEIKDFMKMMHEQLSVKVRQQ